MHLSRRTLSVSLSLSLSLFSFLSLLSLSLSRTPGKGRFWLIVGDPKTNKLLSIKRVNPPAAGAPLRTKLDIVAPETLGKHSALLYLISDSYLGCDQQYELNMNVLEAVDDDDDDEDEPVESL